MLKHRAKILRLTETKVNGYVNTSWTTVKVTPATTPPTDLTILCFLDLNFIRKGKDPVWSPEAGRTGDRTGVLFAMPDAPLMPGDRVLMTRGPVGTFAIEMAVDEAWRPDDMHHLEIGVVEVAKSLTGKPS